MTAPVDPTASNRQRHRVWDLPTRVFHWALVGLLVMQYGTGEWHWLSMEWHFYLGYFTIALIVFRIAWGFVGSDGSRFATFVRGPRAMIDYVRAVLSGTHPEHATHNPLGAWSAVLLIALVFVQGVTGLFSADDMDDVGPLADWIGGHWSHELTDWHEIGVNVLLVVVAAHVAAVLYHVFFVRDGIVAAMFTGRKWLVGDPNYRFRSVWLAIAIFVVAMVGISLLSKYGPTF